MHPYRSLSIGYLIYACNVTVREIGGIREMVGMSRIRRVLEDIDGNGTVCIEVND